MQKSTYSRKKRPFFDPNFKYVPGKSRYSRPAPDPLNPYEEFKQTRSAKEATFQNLVEIAANRFNMGRQLESIRICHEARKILPELLAKPSNSAASLNFQVISFVDGTLTIGALNSTWAHQLTINKHRLQIELEKKLGPNLIKRIAIRAISGS